MNLKILNLPESHRPLLYCLICHRFEQTVKMCYWVNHRFWQAYQHCENCVCALGPALLPIEAIVCTNFLFFALLQWAMLQGDVYLKVCKDVKDDCMCVRDHVEWKVSKYGLTQKNRKRKRKLLTKNEELDKRHTQTYGSLIETFWRSQLSFSIRREYMYHPFWT